MAELKKVNKSMIYKPFEVISKHVFNQAEI